MTLLNVEGSPQSSKGNPKKSGIPSIKNQKQTVGTNNKKLSVIGSEGVFKSRCTKDGMFQTISELQKDTPSTQDSK